MIFVVHLVGRCNGEVFEDQDASFVIGEGSEQGVVIEGVETALKKFKKGEKSLLKIKASQAFGVEGNEEKKIPKGADVEYEVTLKDFEKVCECVTQCKYDKYNIRLISIEDITQNSRFKIIYLTQDSIYNISFHSGALRGLIGSILYIKMIGYLFVNTSYNNLLFLFKVKESWEMDQSEKIEQAEIVKTKGTNHFKVFVI